MKTKLWNRDFTLLVLGQVISIFGNMILSFALPLYILYISGSSALFGLVLGLTYIPLLIMSPIGGLIADRFRKQRVMFWLDASTTVLIVTYIIVSGLVVDVLPIVIVKLMALNAIQGVYMPAVSASIPVLVQEDRLVSANAVVNSINSTSSMIGMAVAGVLFSAFGLLPILVVSAICFAITAVMDLFIRIPFKPQDSSGGIIKIVKSDLSQALKFVREHRVILDCAILAFMFSATLMSMLLVGIPVLVSQHLAMGMDFVGLSQSFMMAGGILGGVLTGILGNRLKVTTIYLLIMSSALVMIPVGIVLFLDMPSVVIYVSLTLACFLAMVLVTTANIQIVSLIQNETPTELIGKVISIIVMLPFLANALGQLMYGFVFEAFEASPYLVVFVTVGLVVGIALYTRKCFKDYTLSR